MNRPNDVEWRRRILQEGAKTPVEITMQGAIRMAVYFLEAGRSDLALRVLNGENGVAINPSQSKLLGSSAKIMSIDRQNSSGRPSE